ncbi:MAG: HDOD domain-containing protein [Desulfobacterales bacterium]|jgi:HD-like signal output (HDOD) protein|nr:HDOD domain-containing protein [Desulfobacterales bacterium]
MADTPHSSGGGPAAAGDIKSQALRSLVKLSPRPLVILRAREVLADPNAGLRDLTNIIEDDLALVAKVLALANSAYFGIGGQVSSVRHAAALLGFQTLGELITLSASALWLGCELTAYRLNARRVWAHSLATALCARRIAATRFPEIAADAFVVGLLHDAGKVILEPFLQQRQAQLDAVCRPLAPVTRDAERQILGIDHAEMMARACRFWRFPESLTQAIRFHHSPALPAQSALAHIAHTANAVAHRAEALPGQVETIAVEAEALDFLMIDREDLDRLQADMIAGVRKLEGEPDNA